MHSVVETPAFLADAKSASVTDEELVAIIVTIAADPTAGVVIPGTGGARKVRIGGRGKGKSGGYRIITYFAAEDVPVFLLRLISKGQSADIGQADRNELRQILPLYTDAYRRNGNRNARDTKTR